MKKLTFLLLVLFFKLSFAINNKQALVFIFSSKCPHCVSFAPIVSKFAHNNKLNVEAITLDNKGLPAYPSPRMANQEIIDTFFQGKTVIYPALFIVDIYYKKIFPISYGEINYSQLKNRFNSLKIKLDDYLSKEGY